MMIITGRQLRAACALVGLHQKSLAERSGVSIQTIQHMESFDAAMIGCKPVTLDKVTEALSSSGVIFIDGGVQMLPGKRLLIRDPIRTANSEAAVASSAVAKL
jgi:transcriptional regulator with XRE-family HTH domain